MSMSLQLFPVSCPVAVYDWHVSSGSPPASWMYLCAPAKSPPWHPLSALSQLRTTLRVKERRGMWSEIGLQRRGMSCCPPPPPPRHHLQSAAETPYPHITILPWQWPVLPRSHSPAFACRFTENRRVPTLSHLPAYTYCIDKSVWGNAPLFMMRKRSESEDVDAKLQHAPQ